MSAFASALLPQEPLERCLAANPSTDQDSDTPSLKRQGDTGSAVVAGTTLVRRTSQTVSLPSPARTSGSRGDSPWQALFHAGASRMEFLWASIGRLYHSRVVEDMSAFRPSSVRQYEFNWRGFRSFVKERRVDRITEATVLEFLFFPTRKRGRHQQLQLTLPPLLTPLNMAGELSLTLAQFSSLNVAYFTKTLPLEETALFGP